MPDDTHPKPQYVPRAGETIVSKTIIKLPPVELRVSSSAKQMAIALKEFADGLQHVAKRLEEREPGQTFRVQIRHRQDGSGSIVYHTMDCNGGGGGNGGGE